MTFPHLIFENEILPVSSESEIVSDLKLDLLFSEEVSRFFVLQPEKNTLLLRREMFSALLADAQSDQRLAELITLLSESKELYRAMTAALSEKTAAYVFAFLLDKLALFCQKAKEMKGYGALFDRFSACFAEYSEESDFVSAANEAKDICDALRRISSFSLKTSGENAKVLAAGDGGITDALLACAKELDIPIKERTPFAFTLNKSIAEAL